MNTSALIEKYPHLFHTAFAENWENINKHGLLSTSALLDLFEITGKEREEIECTHRSRNYTITHPVHGTAVIRDQHPLNEKKLRSCLRGMTVQEWYKLLNGMVFFWTDRSDLDSMRGAYPDVAQRTFVVDTRKLIDKHESKVRLSSINSGSVLYKPAFRGRNTFVPVFAFDYNEEGKVKELTVKDKVEDILDLLA